MKSLEEKQLTVSSSVRTSLDTMVYWGKFLAIVGYIGVAFMVLAFFGMLAMGSNFDDGYGDNVQGVAFVYLIMAGLYFFPVNYLYIFSTRTRKALNSNNQIDLDHGLSNLGSNFKFIGVMTLVVLSIYVLIFVVAILGFTI